MDTRAQKLWQRGMVHFRQGNMEAAQANFEAFLAREPGSGPGLFRLSLVHARRGRHAAATVLAEQALDSDPDRVEILTHLARCHSACGRPEAARAAATRALAMPRDNPVVLDSLGVVMTRLDEQALAMELFDQAIALDPRQPSMLFNRALAQKQFGLLEGAEADLETCIALRPDHAKAHWVLANLRQQDLAGNHLRRLEARLAGCAAASVDEEWLALALFKERDDLGDVALAWPALQRGIGSRRGRAANSAAALGASVDALIAMCDADYCRTPSTASGPVFVFGMPRSGVALLGNLLSRHSRIAHLGVAPALSRWLNRRIGRDSPRGFEAAEIFQCATLDLSGDGPAFLAEAAAGASGPLVMCESQPMDFLLAGFIARALPGARMLHMVRDPVDTCVSILAQAGSDALLPSHDAGELAACYQHYHRLMRHWHQVLPGQVMDVGYESLVEKPEMVLRVVCAFLGIRYGSSLRMGLQLHHRSIGRGARYADRLPALTGPLAALQQRSRSA